MEKKTYRGIVMEVSSYDSSKDMMRRGLSGGAPELTDNFTKLTLQYINIREALDKLSESRFEAGFKGRVRGRYNW